MKVVKRMAVILLGTLVLLAGLLYWGLQFTPQPFSAYAESTHAVAFMPVPSGLPAPVERYYRTTLGEQVPVIETAVMSARGFMHLGVKIPIRIRMIHWAGQGYYTMIQPTLFGRPVLTWLDTYLNGSAHVDMPPGIPDNDPKMNLSSNLALWAESTAIPSLFLTDPRVSWEPVDETHARLIVPSPEGRDSFTVTFDSATGEMTGLEALRWRDRKDSAKSVWRTAARGAWSNVAWNDEAPWFEMVIDEVVTNVDVSAYIK